MKKRCIYIILILLLGTSYVSASEDEAVKKITVTVKTLPSGTAVIKIDKNTTTKGLKQEISQLMNSEKLKPNIPVDKQLLIYEGKKLEEDDFTLQNYPYGITDSPTIHVVEKKKPDSPIPSSGSDDKSEVSDVDEQDSPKPGYTNGQKAAAGVVIIILVGGVYVVIRQWKSNEEQTDQGKSKTESTNPKRNASTLIKDKTTTPQALDTQSTPQ